nr:immunoglobulin light chain junction region [Macaca mulatta]MPN89338.1 immunoglobulin light chain junction region [Macaca mulatta]MPN89979.1 immunoglobulin light chain junction region [Macaca mulatta]
CRQALQTPYSF